MSEGETSAPGGAFGGGADAWTGGCQCGAVRFRALVAPEPATICHCRMCQKAFGSLFAPLASVPRDKIVWTRGAPKMFASSDLVDRGFCANCGTPLTFVFRDGATVDVSVGAFDRPERIDVVEQFWTSMTHPAFGKLHTLPLRPEDAPSYQPKVAAIAASNHQHPDHDTARWAPRPSAPLEPGEPGTAP